MRLAGNKGELVELFSARELRETVLGRFPELRAEIDDDDGIHLVMSALSRTIVEAVCAGTQARAESVLAFVDGLLDRTDLDPEILNAMAISFIEPEEIEASELGRRLWAQLSERLRARILENGNRIARPA